MHPWLQTKVQALKIWQLQSRPQAHYTVNVLYCKKETFAYIRARNKTHPTCELLKLVFAHYNFGTKVIRVLLTLAYEVALGKKRLLNDSMKYVDVIANVSNLYFAHHCRCRLIWLELPVELG